MKVKILYFSSVKDKIGIQSEEVEFEGKTVADLKQFIVEKYPQLRENLEKVMFAVNEEYAKLTTNLKNGDTIAVIPPVSGG